MRMIALLSTTISAILLQETWLDENADLSTMSYASTFAQHVSY